MIKERSRRERGSDREESEGAIERRARKRSQREREKDREESGKARPKRARNDRSREDEESFQLGKPFGAGGVKLVGRSDQA